MKAMKKMNYNVELKDNRDGSITIKLGDGWFYDDMNRLAAMYGYPASDNPLTIKNFKVTAVYSAFYDVLLNYLLNINKNLEKPLDGFQIVSKSAMYDMKWTNVISLDSNGDIIDVVHGLDGKAEEDNKEDMGEDSLNPD